MVDLITFIICLYSLLYLFVALLITFGEFCHYKGPLPVNVPMVSVVLCARNEESVLHQCLNSLRLLNYPRDKLEIILVDNVDEVLNIALLKEDNSEEKTNFVPADKAQMNTQTGALPV